MKNTTDLIAAYNDAIALIGKRGTLKDARYNVSTAERECGSMSRVYVDESTSTKAGFIEYCKNQIALLTGAHGLGLDWAEAPEVASTEIVEITKLETEVINADERLISFKAEGERKTYTGKDFELQMIVDGNTVSLGESEVVTFVNREPEIVEVKATIIDEAQINDITGEIIQGDIHCYKKCGYNCKAQVKADLEKHYSAMLEDLGEGWVIRTWHNCGWHCEALHPASGFSLSDGMVSGGSDVMRKYYTDSSAFHESRYRCSNYGGQLTSQVRAFGATPREAVTACMRQMVDRCSAYISLIQLLR